MLLLAALFLLATDLRTAYYHSFDSLSWSLAQGYEADNVPIASLAGVRAMGSIDSTELTHTRSIQSAPIELKEQGLLIEFAAGPDNPDCSLSLTFLDKDLRPLHAITLPSSAVTTWSRAKVELPSLLKSHQDVRISLEQFSNAGCWSAVRDRIEWVSFSPFLSLQQLLRGSFIVSSLLCICFAAVIVWCLVSFLAAQRTNLQVFVVILIFSLVTQFRFSGYFHWDAWHALQRYAQQGVSSVFLTHNEHFLPLFFGFYANEALLLQGAYQPMVLLSCFLHAVFSFLLFQILQLFGAQRYSACMLALLFAMSSLHGESIQWAFEQSLLLCHLALILSLLAGFRFIDNGQLRYAVASCALATAAPLFFGNGFVIVGYWPLLLITRLFFLSSHLRKQAALRGAILFVAILVCITIPLSAYVILKGDNAHAVAQESLLENLGEVFSYVFVGSQVGTVIRGLGFVPSLELGVSPYIIAEALKIVDLSSFSHIPAEMLLAYFAFGVSLLLLAVSLKFGKNALLFWVAGQLFILGSLALPALGRWKFGLAQSLSLRYHYGSLFGLLLMCLPLVQYAFAGQRLAGVRARLALILIWLYLSVHLWTATQFTYFQNNGQRHRLFIDSLVDWRQTIGEEVSYEAIGTSYEGLQPSYPQTLTPGKHPNEISAVMNWLHGGKTTNKTNQQH